MPLALAGLWAVGLRYNASSSVPRGLYLVRPFVLAEVGRGAYVCLRAWADAASAALRGTEWALERKVLLKRAEGLPRDRISDEGGVVAVNGTPLPGSRRLARDSQGRALPRPSLPVRLGETEFWLASSEGGFDSRYFGPVHRAALSCIAEPLWTF